MSTRRRPHARLDARRTASQRQPARSEPVEEVACVAHAKREVLLRAYRHLLRWEDLEDCYIL
jgi:hypothetical protein